MSKQDGFTVFSTHPPVEKARKIIEDIGELIIDEEITREKFLKDVSKYDGVLAGTAIEYDDEVFKKSNGNLKVVARVGVGYDNVDVEAATKNGVMAANTPGVMAESVAEHAILLALAASKDLALSDREVREGKWEWGKYRGTEFWGNTFGQIGLGRIGYPTAKKAKAFNMNVLVFDPYVDESKVLDMGAKLVDLDDLLKESDVISINCPLTEDTRHLIGKEEFEMMKESAIIVNTSRGPVIDEEAMIDALKTGQIAKAGLDVFESEPIEKDNPLLEMDNVTLTPHTASNTDHAVERMFVEAARAVSDALTGRRPKFLLNEEVLE